MLQSLSLKAIQLLCDDLMAHEDEVNGDRLGEFNGKWQDDPDVGCLKKENVSRREAGSWLIWFI